MTHIHYKQMADPSFNKPGKIDLLIGDELFFNLLKVGSSHGTIDQTTL